MAILSQGSFLGEAANRLYRVLGLDGVVSPKVDDTIQPVVIVGDGTYPGMGSRLGRRWMASALTASTTPNASVLQALEDLVLDRMWCCSTGGAAVSIVRVNFNPVAGLTPLAGLASFAQFLDRADNTNDRPQAALGVTTQALLAGTEVMTFDQPIQVPTGSQFFYPLDFGPAGFFMEAGSAIGFYSNLAAATVRANFYGRTFG